MPAHLKCFLIQIKFGGLQQSFLWVYLRSSLWHQPNVKHQQVKCTAIQKAVNGTLLGRSVVTVFTTGLPGVAMQSQNLMLELWWPVWISENLVLPKLWHWLHLHALQPTDVCTLLWQIAACLCCLDLFPFSYLSPNSGTYDSCLSCSRVHNYASSQILRCHTSIKGDASLVTLSVSRLLT